MAAQPYGRGLPRFVPQDLVHRGRINALPYQADG